MAAPAVAVMVAVPFDAPEVKVAVATPLVVTLVYGVLGKLPRLVVKVTAVPSATYPLHASLTVALMMAVPPLVWMMVGYRLIAIVPAGGPAVTVTVVVPWAEPAFAVMVATPRAVEVKVVVAVPPVVEMGLAMVPRVAVNPTGVLSGTGLPPASFTVALMLEVSPQEMTSGEAVTVMVFGAPAVRLTVVIATRLLPKPTPVAQTLAVPTVVPAVSVAWAVPPDVAVPDRKASMKTLLFNAFFTVMV